MLFDSNNEYKQISKSMHQLMSTWVVYIKRIHEFWFGIKRFCIGIFNVLKKWAYNIR